MPRTVTAFDSCYQHVVWAQMHGVQRQPQLYPGLALSARIEQFQELFHKTAAYNCSVATLCCAGLGRSSGERGQQGAAARHVLAA
jgi:hypothetical protein